LFFSKYNFHKVLGLMCFIYCVTVVAYTGWAKKTAHYTLVHIFAKY